MEEKPLLNVQDIDAAISIGQVYSGKIWSRIFFGGLIVSGCLGIAAIICIIFDNGDNFGLYFLIGIGIFLFADLCALLLINSGKKKVKLWLQDAIVLKANCEKIDDSLEVRYPGIAAKATAIQIRFRYMGKKVEKSSVQKGKFANLPVYNKYADKHILIAYSPKYDQVMLIKPKSEQRILAEMSK